MVDRMRPAKEMLSLIQLLSARKADGLTLEEIAANMSFSKRTAQRYMSALKEIELELTYHEDGQAKRWYLPSTRTRVPPVTAEQLSSLTAIASFMRAQGHEAFTETLLDLRDTLQAGLDRMALLRIDPDLEALDANVAATHRPGPKATYDVSVKRMLLDAILSERQVSFEYTNVRGLKRSNKTVSPYSIMVGPREYLIARDVSLGGIRSYALTGITDLQMLEGNSDREDFDPSAYANRSFGAFHDGQFHKWTLRFKPDTAHELKSYQFHPSQTMTILDSGEIEVVFECESIREVAYECFRWSEHLTSIGPEELRAMVREISANMEAACANAL